MQEDRQSSATPDKTMTPFNSSRWKMILYGAGVAVVLALYLWSRGGGTTHVRVEVRDNAYTLSLDGHTILSEKISAWDTGGIGYKQYRKAVPIIPQYQAITNIVVTDLDTNEILFTENFEGSKLDKSTWPLQLGQWEVRNHALTGKDQEAALLHPEAWRNYAFEADVRNMLGAQFYVRVQDQNDYVGCFMRPFRDFDGNFFVIKKGRKTFQTPVKTVLLSPTQTAKRSLNLVLHYFPHFVVLFILAILLTLALTHLLHWLYLYLNRFITITVKAPPPKCPFTVERCFTGLALLLVVAAFFWLLHVTSAYLEKIPHVQDSATMVFQAKTLASGRLWAPEPESPNSFTLSEPFIYFRNGKMYGQYPLAHPLFIVPGAWLNAVWIMPAVGGSLLLLLTFLIGKELLSAPWGFLSALLLFCSPFFQMSAPNFMSHTTGSVYLALSIYFFLRAHGAKPTLRFSLLSGIFLGLLFHTRPLTCGAICLSYALYMLYTLVTDEHRKLIFVNYCLLLTAFFSMFALIFLYNYSLTGHVLQSPYQAGAARVFKAFDWARGAKAFIDNYTLASLFLMVLFGWSGLLTNVFLFGNLLPRAQSLKCTVLLLSSVVLVFVAYMLYSISSVTVMYGPRYVFEITFLHVLLVVWGAHSVTDGLQRIAAYYAGRHFASQVFPVPGDHRLIPPLVGILAKSTLLVILLLMSASSFNSWTSKTYRPWPGNTFVPQNLHELKGFNYTSPVVQKLVKSRGITKALVFVQGPRYQWWHYGSVFPENTPTFDGDVVYAKDVGPTANQKVISQYPNRGYYMANYQRKTLWEIDEGLRRVAAQSIQSSAEPSDP